MTVGHAVGVGLLRVRWVESTFVAIAARLGQHEPAWATGGMVPPMAAQAARSTHSVRRAPNQRAARAAASPLACASRSLLTLSVQQLLRSVPPKRFSEAFLQALPRNYNEICRGWVQPGWIDNY
jgi:hypothetical protein